MNREMAGNKRSQEELTLFLIGCFFLFTKALDFYEMFFYLNERATLSGHGPTQ